MTTTLGMERDPATLMIWGRSRLLAEWWDAQQWWRWVKYWPWAGTSGCTQVTTRIVWHSEQDASWQLCSPQAWPQQFGEAAIFPLFSTREPEIWSSGWKKFSAFFQNNPVLFLHAPNTLLLIQKGTDADGDWVIHQRWHHGERQPGLETPDCGQWGVLSSETYQAGGQLPFSLISTSISWWSIWKWTIHDSAKRTGARCFRVGFTWNGHSLGHCFF